MDSTFADQSYDGTYSHIPRSRASSSGVSTTEGLFQNLQLAESPSLETASYTTSSSRPPSSRGLASPVYLSPSLSHDPSSYLSHPLPQHQHDQPSFQPIPANNVSDTEWFETDQTSTRVTPLLRLEPAPDSRDTPSSPPPLASIEPGAMSTVAVHYDTGFSMGSRSNFTWPVVMDSGSGLLQPDISQYGSEASLSPPSASRSVTGSPPRSNLTPEQRELKRQRDQHRHSSKLQVRGRRAGSGSDSMYSPPATLADLSTGPSAIPVYTTAPPPMPLMAEPQPPQYLPPFSPQIPDQGQASMFTNPYPPQSYMPDYGYQASAPPSLPSQFGYVSNLEVGTKKHVGWMSNSGPNSPSMGIYPGQPVMGQNPHDTTGQVRVVHSRPKPQCWEHGCNGRQFSTFSNLLRHQREKSGQATKATCPNCGAEFTRTTARNGHLQHDKCKKKSRD
ncbi:hypothetical protein QBC38DRAFT_355796 [Podospora fimiseda]|uniref:Uncharacterized protein n=1 Tax=Podospora fimiseda TaxID=252190 RepID=A0AAN7BWP1_9PEZI|nr:hypothetical protein QBC38DRAFT_355796 [Podospora fimiseda]